MQGGDVLSANTEVGVEFLRIHALGCGLFTRSTAMQLFKEQLKEGNWAKHYALDLRS